MKFLAFSSQAAIASGRRIRTAAFSDRSLLAIPAACAVANGVRETLSELLKTPVSLRLSEPSIPDAQAWNAIACDARLYGVRGSAAEAAIVLREADALALAAAVFGEAGGAARPLSVMEAKLLERVVAAAARWLAPVCGRDVGPVQPLTALRGWTTYFELLIERPFTARAGIALSREPAGTPGPGLRIEDLLEVEVELAVSLGPASVEGAAILGLRHGQCVPMMIGMGESGLLRAGGVTLAAGECGARAGRRAFALRRLVQR